MPLLDDVDHHLVVRERKHVKVHRRQHPRPRIKHLDRLRARLDLVARVCSNVLRDFSEQRVHDLRLRIHQLFRDQVVARGATLNTVRRKRVGSPDEPKHGGFVSDFGAQVLQRLAHERSALDRVKLVHACDVVHCSDRLLDDRTFVLRDLKVDPHSGERCKDIREKNDAVGLERAPWLQRNFGRKVGILGALAERRVLPREVLVHLHVPPGLPHHPYRRAFDLFVPCRSDQQRRVLLSSTSGSHSHSRRASCGHRIVRCPQRAPGPLVLALGLALAPALSLARALDQRSVPPRARDAHKCRHLARRQPKISSLRSVFALAQPCRVASTATAPPYLALHAPNLTRMPELRTSATAANERMPRVVTWSAARHTASDGWRECGLRSAQTDMTEKLGEDGELYADTQYFRSGR
mmetsp:Transcript_3594/g.9992  ORF Transcript_3594/g.9992 Transcript_3594/m.9992 type:complete len:409 (+) Transcript_3594:356-1582(+)